MITTNERGLLVAIRDNEFNDGNPLAKVWVDCIPGWTDKTKFGGTMASLVKKGLARTDGEVCWLTEVGLAVANASAS